MHYIKLKENIIEHGSIGYLGVNDKYYMILKVIEDDKKYLLINNIQEIFYLDIERDTFESLIMHESI